MDPQQVLDARSHFQIVATRLVQVRHELFRRLPVQRSEKKLFDGWVVGVHRFGPHRFSL